MIARAGVLAVAGGCLLLAACGAARTSGEKAAGPTVAVLSPGADGVQAVEVGVGDNYRFSPSVLDAHVGEIRLTLRHVGNGAPHTLYGADVPGMRVPLVRAGQSQTVQFRASHPGSYRFVCTIHEAQGEIGQLVVSPSG